MTRRVLATGLAGLLLSGCQLVAAARPYIWRYDPDVFRPTGSPAPPIVAEAESEPAPRPKRPPRAVLGRLRGKATHYCCTASHGPGELVAAAGPKLRVGRWRGRTVSLSWQGRSIRVRLVDWCQCLRGTPAERLIDLQPAAFEHFAPLRTGVLEGVEVTW